MEGGRDKDWVCRAVQGGCRIFHQLSSLGTDHTGQWVPRLLCPVVPVCRLWKGGWVTGKAALGFRGQEVGVLLGAAATTNILIS